MRRRRGSSDERQLSLMEVAERCDEAEREARVRGNAEEDPRRYEDVDGLPRWVRWCMEDRFVPGTWEKTSG